MSNNTEKQQAEKRKHRIIHISLVPLHNAIRKSAKEIRIADIKVKRMQARYDKAIKAQLKLLSK